MVELKAIGLGVSAYKDAFEGSGLKFIFVGPPLFPFLLDVSNAEEREEGAVVGLGAEE